MRAELLPKNLLAILTSRIKIQKRSKKQCLLFRRQLNNRRIISLSPPPMDQKINSSLPSEGQGPAYALNEAVESLEDYGPGGYHPIHLGDTFSAGRYEVICKLGYGSYSTVWLCRDKTEQRYVAVKVTISDDGSVERRNQHESKILLALRNGNLIHPGRRFVIISLDEFTIQGPNGRHQCFVFPVALNSVGTAKRASTRDDSMFPAQIARSIATQAILALSYIHSCGLIHSGMLIVPIPDMTLVSLLSKQRSAYRQPTYSSTIFQLMAAIETV